MPAAWAEYEEEEIADRSGPVLIGQCEATLVVHEKAVNGNPDPAGCLNFELGKGGFYVEFEGIGRDTCTQIRVTCLDSIFQTFGLQGADVISTRGW